MQRRKTFWGYSFWNRQEENYDIFAYYHNHNFMLHLYKAEGLKRIGKVPLCNGKSERAPHICGKCFILCWRCTALSCSMLLSALLSFCFTGNTYIEAGIRELFLAGVLLVPTLLDGVRQYFFNKESTNHRRIIWGTVSGVGLWIIASWIRMLF